MRHRCATCNTILKGNDAIHATKQSVCSACARAISEALLTNKVQQERLTLAKLAREAIEAGKTTFTHDICHYVIVSQDSYCSRWVANGVQHLGERRYITSNTLLES